MLLAIASTSFPRSASWNSFGSPPTASSSCTARSSSFQATECCEPRLSVGSTSELRCDGKPTGICTDCGAALAADWRVSMKSLFVERGPDERGAGWYVIGPGAYPEREDSCADWGGAWDCGASCCDIGGSLVDIAGCCDIGGSLVDCGGPRFCDGGGRCDIGAPNCCDMGAAPRFWDGGGRCDIGAPNCCEGGGR